MAQKATRQKVRMRGLISGASGSGKTTTSLLFATALARHYSGKIVVIDTQGGQSLDYVDTEFAPLGFDIEQVSKNITCENIRGIFSKLIACGEYSVVVLDTISSLWDGEGGILSRATGGADSFSQWNALKAPQKKFITDIQNSPVHFLTTVRVKTAWDLRKVQDDKGREKTQISRMGMEPIQDKNLSYEFSFQARMDEYHSMTVERTSCPELDNKVIQNPGEDTIRPLIEWMEKGVSSSTVGRVVGRKARPEQLREYFDLCRRQGVTEEKATFNFFNVFGIKPDEASEDMLEERLEDNRKRVGAMRPAKKTVTVITTNADGDTHVETNSEEN